MRAPGERVQLWYEQICSPQNHCQSATIATAECGTEYCLCCGRISRCGRINCSTTVPFGAFCNIICLADSPTLHLIWQFINMFQSFVLSGRVAHTKSLIFLLVSIIWLDARQSAIPPISSSSLAWLCSLLFTSMLFICKGLRLEPNGLLAFPRHTGFTNSLKPPRSPTISGTTIDSRDVVSISRSFIDHYKILFVWIHT